MTEPGHRMRTEIAQQPVIVEQIARERQEIAHVAAHVNSISPRFVLIAARGTSDHAALYLKYLIEVALRLPCGLASPSTTTVYGARPDFTDVLWVAVSQSGQSPDLVEATAAAQRAGALTVAMTNNPGSALDASAALSVAIKAGQEAAVAAIKTYTATLLALWLLVDFWRDRDGSACLGLSDAVAQVVDDDRILQVADRLRFADGLVVTGRGYSYPTAREGALKLMETAYLSAHAFSGADLLHGPLALVSPERPVIAVIPPGAAGRAMIPVLERLNERGSEVVTIGSNPGNNRAAGMVLPAVLDELSPIVEVVPLQRLAHSMAIARRVDPDAPRGLAKVTHNMTHADVHRRTADSLWAGT